MSVPEFYNEAHVATKLGLTRRQIKNIRGDLSEGIDWALVDHSVALTPQGLEKLRTAVEAPAALDFTECRLIKKEEAGEPLTFTVDRILPNKRLLLASLPGAGVPSLIRVADNSNFRPRMQLRARPSDTFAGQPTYQLVGACPRQPGRY